MICGYWISKWVDAVEERHEARADAVKVALECRELQAEKACQTNMLSSERAAYKSASGRAAKLQAELDDCKKEMWRIWR